MGRLRDSRSITGKGFEWIVDPAIEFPRLMEWYGETIHRMAVFVAQFWAPQIENWMKENAPWTDRTGNARQGLYTEVNDVVGQMVVIILSHGVEYGKWLELKNAGRYAVVTPALDEFGPKVWNDLRKKIQVAF